jgi:hypothetical protein
MGTISQLRSLRKSDPEWRITLHAQFLRRQRNGLDNGSGRGVV